MQKQDIELGKNLFVHRKSQVYLLTKTTTKVTCKDASQHASIPSLSDKALQPYRLWLPRARIFPLSIQLHFADDVDLAPIASQDVDSIIADLVEGAELWAQLGYEANQVQCHSGGHNETARTLKLEFELQSRTDLDFQSWCPVGLASWDLDSVQLRLQFTGEHRPGEDPEGCAATAEQRHEHVGEPQSNVAEDESARLQHQAASTPYSTSKLAQSSSHIRPMQLTEKSTLLDEIVLSALFDAGLRSSICFEPTRLSAGVISLTEQGDYRLCDLAPATFVPHYLQRLQEQAGFIAGISRLLANFQNFPRSAASKSPTKEPSEQGSNTGDREGGATKEIQRHLWDTVKNGIRTHGSARRLRPLRRSANAKVPRSILDFPNILSLPEYAEAETKAGKGFGIGLEQASNDQAMSDEDLFHFCLRFDDQADTSWKTIPTVTTKGINGGHSSAEEGMHDVEIEGSGQRMGEIYGCPFEVNTATGPPQDENRNYSNSLSQMSDVSMLLPFEEPMKDGRIIGEPQAIGGSSWLTQNVIRMHPLRQQRHKNHWVGQGNHTGRRDSLYERPGLGWWSDPSDASEEPLEDYRDHYTKLHLDDFCSSPFSSIEEERLHDYLDIRPDPGEDLIGGKTTPMSTSQAGETPNSSLSEVLGNDHLLWHMWKRRASVAPRGEEDITDMKTMFATDPDMKLFSSRWDLDPSEISSGSNEDPMLHETIHNQSPRDKATSPITPNSERRSYFIPTRSSSSSGYVGRSSSDPKRRSSLIKRFTWGGRHNAPQAALEMSKLDQRTMEVKRRKTLDDYEMMDREASDDDSNDMLF